jgi:hypothetical protein
MPPEGTGRRLPLKKSQRILPQAGLAAAGVRHAALELRPKGPAVTADMNMDELVKDDVVGEVRREGGEAGVELDAAGAGCAAPERCLATDAQPPGRIAVLPGEGAQASGEDGAGGPPVEPIGREDGLAAAAAGALQTGERPPDPAELGQGEPVGLIE